MNKNHVNDHKGGKKSYLNSKSISIKNNKVVEKTLRPDKLSTNETTTSSQNFKIEKTSFKSKASLDLYAQVLRYLFSSSMRIEANSMF